MDKSQLRTSLLAALQTEFDNLVRAAHMAREEATSEESRAENKYDTRGQEAAYLAEGQARLAAELQETLALYQSLPLPDFSAAAQAEIGAVVTLQSPRGSPALYFLGPRSGGLEFDCAGARVIVVTPQSPLGRQLLGRRVGETVQLPSRSGPSPHRVTALT